MLNYNSSGIECSYIQNLLASIYVPKIRILNSIEDALKGESFIYKNGLYKYDAQDVLGNIYNEETKSYEPTVIRKAGINYIAPYEYGKKYILVSDNHISESNFYNSKLHIALGDYLRFQKSYYGIDLMPLYNCFSNQFIENFSLPLYMRDVGVEESGSIVGTVPVKAGTKLFAFPIRWGASYTIYCKGNCTALVQPAYYNGDILIKPTGTSQTIFEMSTLLLTEDGATYEMSEFKNLQDLQNERYLYLLVELPQGNAENLVIIENNSNAVVNNSLIKNKKQSPFSDKLMGYLLNYFITPASEIQQNIAKIQTILDPPSGVPDCEKPAFKRPNGAIFKRQTLSEYCEEVGGKYVKGIFGETTYEFIYNLCRYDGIEDFTGYIDKDVEWRILNGN